MMALGKRIHPLGTMTDCTTFIGNPSRICWDIWVRTKAMDRPTMVDQAECCHGKHNGTVTVVDNRDFSLTTGGGATSAHPYKSVKETLCFLVFVYKSAMVCRIPQKEDWLPNKAVVLFCHHTDVLNVLVLNRLHCIYDFLIFLPWLFITFYHVGGRPLGMAMAVCQFLLLMPRGATVISLSV